MRLVCTRLPHAAGPGMVAIQEITKKAYAVLPTARRAMINGMDT